MGMSPVGMHMSASLDVVTSGPKPGDVAEEIRWARSLRGAIRTDCHLLHLRGYELPVSDDGLPCRSTDHQSSMSVYQRVCQA